MRFELLKYPGSEVEIIYPPMIHFGSRVIIHGDDCYMDAQDAIYDKGENGKPVLAGYRFIKVDWWKMSVDHGNADITGG